jgi:glycosyltransferase involved in cell wall biosynthesis
VRVAVYAIAKNEAHHVDRFVAAAWDADAIVVLDTGSLDDTHAKLERYSNRVAVHWGTIQPWRFDDARNASLALVPPTIDVCICLDLDEVLQPGWREALERDWKPGTTRLRYPYVWNWLEDGSPGVSYYADKIHARHGYRWRLPCHEVLQRTGDAEVVSWSEGLTVHHHADNGKSRHGYLDLMEAALFEEPDNDRMQHYYARELFGQGRMVEASEMFQRHLANPKATWRHERSQSMLYLARVGGNEAWVDMWLMRAAAECPERREVWVALAEREARRGHASLAVGYTLRAMELPEDRYYLSDPKTRGDKPLEAVREILNWGDDGEEEAAA